MLLGALALAVVFPITSKLAPVSATIDSDVYKLSLETSNNIDLTLNPVTAGALSVAKDTVTGSTTSPNGYKLYISTASNTSDITLDAHNTPNVNVGNNIIRAGGGSFTSPAALTLTSAQNAVWGYAIPTATGFSPVATYETPTAEGFSNAKFATMPTVDNGQLILSRTGVGDATVDIYYGAKANLSLASGNYKGTIRYIIVSDATDVTNGEAKIALGSDTPSSNVELTDGYTATGATILTSLNTNLELSTDTTTSVTISNTGTNNTCANPTISQTSGTAVISCTIPAGLAIDTYDVAIDISKGIHQFHYEIEDAITVKTSLTTFDQAFASTSKSKVSGTDYYAMQDMAPEICSAVTLLQEGTLVDTRDNNKTYSVAKLDDGNCWMTQNLTLGSTTLGSKTLTSADSDVSSDFPLPAPTTTSFSSSYYNTINYRNYTSNNTNYYNWYTATAGTGTQSTAAYTAATSSICPKGWRLPNGSSASGVAGEWAELFYAAGITGTLATSTSSVSYATGGATKRAAAPYNIPNTYGYFNTTGTAPTSTSYTYFWTNRTYSSANYAWSTYIGSSSATLNYGSRYKYQGMPMRCVAHRAEIKPIITYDANGGSGAPSPIQASSVSEFAQSIVLSSTIPTKSGQSFAGWNTKQDGSGTWYQPSSTITTANDTTLYAIWWTETTTFDSAFATAGKTKVSGTDYYAMQDMSASICDDVTSAFGPMASSTQLIDTRDNKLYWVSKLADGKCWMTQNLDYDLAATIQGDAKTSTTVSGWTNDYNLPYSYDGGSYYSANNGTSNNTSLTAITCNSSTNGGENCHYHIGNYYNWTAAINSANSSSYTTQYFNAPDSICPTGWKLPMGYDGANGDFKTLNNAYGGITNKDDTLRASPLWFVRSGYVNNGSLNYVGSGGSYWSSTVYNSNFAYYLNFGSTSVSPTGIGYRNYGFSVRCVAQ